MKSQNSEGFKIRLLVSYDGTAFCGWQSQGQYKNKLSIQYHLEKALTKIFKEKVVCVASGRTDSGVHALEQNVHFTIEKDPRKIPILLALRTLLPMTISVHQAWIVPSQFSVSRSARAKTYRYFIYTGRVPSAILHRFTYWLPHELDLQRLQEYSKLIEGRHDFKTFQSASGRPPKTSIRRVYRARWLQKKQNLFVFEITGNGFLRQMVRNLVGEQVRMSLEKKPGSDFGSLLEGGARRNIGKPAPPWGLFLARVHYPKSSMIAL